MTISRGQLRIAFLLVIAGSLALSAVINRARRAGSDEHQLQEVRRVGELKVAEGKVVQKERVVAGKAAASSHVRTEISRGAALKARDSIRVIKQDVGGIPERLADPIDNLLTHDDNLERENGDLRRLATVDTTVIVNLGEQLELKKKELELVPKPPRCGAKCGAVLTLLVVIGVAAATK